MLLALLGKGLIDPASIDAFASRWLEAGRPFTS
jgi:hypothetical protein